ncbi:unnamed protein product [Closterium sp. Yama58-4]|nr:unnamed protein product [Closterium sp. Yama58-4]
MLVLHCSGYVHAWNHPSEQGASIQLPNAAGPHSPASDVVFLHKLLEQSRKELKGQVTEGLEKMGLAMLQTKQDSARAAADVADWWRREQGRLKAMSQDVGQLKEIVGQHARKLEAQVRAVQEASGSNEEQQRDSKGSVPLGEEGDKEGDEEGEVVQPEQWQKGRHGALKHFWVTDDRPALWQQRAFQRHGSFGFIKFSAYRVNASTLAVLGLSSLPMHHGRRFSSCRWHAAAAAAAGNGGVSGGGGGVTEGKLVPLYVEEHHDYLYETVVLLCVLDAPSQVSGGVLEAEIDGEVLFPYVEQPGQPMEDPSSFPANIVLCGRPMFNVISARALTEWLHFHRLLLPVDRFVLYDVGAVAGHADVSSAVQPWVRAGVVEVVNFEESTQYDVWSYAQALSTHDCLYGNRHNAQWLLFADLDEFVEVVPPATLQQLLQNNAGRPWITFGCTVFNSSFCHPEEPWHGGPTRRRRLLLGEGEQGGAEQGEGEQGGLLRRLKRQPEEPWHGGTTRRSRRRLLQGEGGQGGEGGGGGGEGGDWGSDGDVAPSRPFIVEGVKLQWPHAYCMNASLYPNHLCLDQFGHRKYILNPRRVSLAQIHVIIGGDMDGLDLPTDVARIAHYRGLAKPAYPMCDMGAPSAWWRYHDGVARMAQAARSCPALVSPVPEVRRVLSGATKRARGYPMCDMGAPSAWWRYHDGVAKMAQAARACPALVAPVPEVRRVLSDATKRPRGYLMCNMGAPSPWWRYRDGVARMAQAARSCPAMVTPIPESACGLAGYPMCHLGPPSTWWSYHDVFSVAKMAQAARSCPALVAVIPEVRRVFSHERTGHNWGLTSQRDLGALSTWWRYHKGVARMAQAARSCPAR